MKRIISIVMPDGYNHPDDFAKDCGVELWDSDKLAFMNGTIRNLRSNLIDNQPVKAFMSVEALQAELTRLTTKIEPEPSTKGTKP